ncbi:transposase [Palleronia caenipelagi]|uniref:transposase n=1 Tax=Palleronia caenipelagi TaxID=2489174 RepID=UPI001FE8FE8A|nr:transposase [Palleronia caenipelagi]
MSEKHGLPKARKTWRKLHIGLDPESGHIVTSRLTTEHVGDPGALPGLLAQVADFVCCFIGDGAYDGAPPAAMIRDVFGPDVELAIPPGLRPFEAELIHRINSLSPLTNRATPSRAIALPAMPISR